MEDEYGNVCDSVDDGEIKLATVAADGGDGPVPRLDGCPATLPVNHGAVKTRPLALAEKQESVPDAYAVRAEYRAAGAAAASDVEPCTLVFAFSDDAARQVLVDNLVSKRDEIDDLVEHYSKWLMKHQRKHEQWRKFDAEWGKRMQEVLRDLIQKKVMLHMPESWKRFSVEPIQHKLQQKQQSIADRYAAQRRHDQNDRRRDNAVVRKLTEDAGYRCVGTVADLGWIINEGVDSVIANYLGSRLQTLVFRSSDALRRAKEAIRGHDGAHGMVAMDNIPMQKLTSGGKIEALPDKDPQPPGCIGYAVNLIEMPSDMLQYRNVFYQLMKGLLIFDKLENARAWRQSELQRGKRGGLPTVFCLDGEKMESSGIEYAGRGAKQQDAGWRFGGPGHDLDPDWMRMRMQEQALEAFRELRHEYDSEANVHHAKPKPGEQERCGRIEHCRESALEKAKIVEALIDTKGPLDPAKVARVCAAEPPPLEQLGATQGSQLPPRDPAGDGEPVPRMDVRQQLSMDDAASGEAAVPHRGRSDGGGGAPGAKRRRV